MAREGERGRGPNHDTSHQGCPWSPVPHFRSEGRGIFHDGVFRGRKKRVEPSGMKGNAAFGWPVFNSRRFSKCLSASLLLSYPPWVLIQTLLKLFPFFWFIHLSQEYLTSRLLFDWTDSWTSAFELVGASLFLPSRQFCKQHWWLMEKNESSDRKDAF